MDEVIRMIVLEGFSMSTFTDDLGFQIERSKIVDKATRDVTLSIKPFF